MKSDAKAPVAPWVLPVVLLIVSTILVYSGVTKNGFVNYDDPIYVTENPHLEKGLTGQSLVWAFTTSYANFWHPVTWISHLLDVEWYGFNPAGHHRTAVLIHLLNTLLLFWVLRKLTAATWRSALVAGLFSLHPLHVESVAWISERKDLLSTFFWLLTMLAYIRYAEAKKATSKQSHAARWYGITILFFVLGLMSKPMLVTLPFVFLLLDAWPLQRWKMAEGQGMAAFLKPARQLVLEKLPMFALAGGACALAFWAQKTGGAVATSDSLPFATRLTNAVLSYERYLWKTILPNGLAIPYPYHTDWTSTEVTVAVLLLAGISVAAVLLARKAPYVGLGWFWYVGTLVPVIGLVQVSSSPMADRYTYVPLIGVFFAVVWSIGELTRKLPHRTIWLGAASLLVFGFFSLKTHEQVGYWRNTETLFSHALRVTRENHIAQYNLGLLYAETRRYEDAILCYQEAVRIKPDFFGAHHNLATLLGEMGRVKEAIPHLQAAVKIEPDQPDAHYNLGLALAATGQVVEAAEHYRRCLKGKPDDLRALNNLAWILATNPRGELRNGNEAIQLSQRACELTQFQDVRCVATLAAAYAEAGDFGNAVQWVTKARDLAYATGQHSLVSKFEERLGLYTARQPTRVSN